MTVVNNADPATSRWHVDRRIPVALIVSMLIAMFGGYGTGAWWLSDLSNAADNNRDAIRLMGVAVQSTKTEIGDKLAEQKKEIQEQFRDIQGDIGKMKEEREDIRIRVIRIEEKLSGQIEQLNRIERAIIGRDNR